MERIFEIMNLNSGRCLKRLHRFTEESADRFNISIFRYGAEKSNLTFTNNPYRIHKQKTQLHLVILHKPTVYAAFCVLNRR